MTRRVAGEVQICFLAIEIDLSQRIQRAVLRYRFHPRYIVPRTHTHTLVSNQKSRVLSDRTIFSMEEDNSCLLNNEKRPVLFLHDTVDTDRSFIKVSAYVRFSERY